MHNTHTHTSIKCVTLLCQNPWKGTSECGIPNHHHQQHHHKHTISLKNKYLLVIYSLRLSLALLVFYIRYVHTLPIYCHRKPSSSTCKSCGIVGMNCKGQREENFKQRSAYQYMRTRGEKTGERAQFLLPPTTPPRFFSLPLCPKK